jgi:hypothetical protein
VKPAGDRRGTHAARDIQREDPLDDRRCALVGDELLALVAAVAEGDAAVGPATLLGSALDPGRDAVDDRGVLELSEHRQHLQHHSPRR